MRTLRTLLISLLLVAFVVPGAVGDEHPASLQLNRDGSHGPVVPSADQSAVRPDPVPGQLHVQFTTSAVEQMQIHMEKQSGLVQVGLASVDALNRDAKATHYEQSFRDLKNRALAEELGLTRWFVIDVDAGADTEALAERYAADANVEAAVAVYDAQFHVVPNDPQYPNNWGHNNTAQLPGYDWGGTWDHTGPPVGTVGFDCNTVQAWDAGFGSASVTIAILDSGTDVDHPDLNVIGGWDYISGDANPDAVSDAHGTCTAGIAAALTNNATGVAGVAGGCGIMALRVSNNVHVSNGLTYAADNGADIASMSFSFTGFVVGGLPDVDAACAYAFTNGVLLLASSGNDNNTQFWVPARHPNVMAIGAASPCGERKRSSSSAAEVNPGVFTDPNGYTCDGERWWGSNYGSNVQNAGDAVELIAPTILPSTDILGAVGYTAGDYEPFFNGTSCSCPYAAGVAALVKSVHPTWTPTQLRDHLRATAQDIVSVESGAGWDRYTGYGMVDASAAVGQPDYVHYLFTGWGDEIVVSDVNTNTLASTPFPAVLNGEGTSYINLGGRNQGSVAATVGSGWSNLLDGSHFATWGIPALLAGQGVYGGNFGFFVHGGRHTVSAEMDYLNVLVESDETNNDHGIQYVFTPPLFASQTSQNRTSPPDPFGGWGSIPAGDPVDYNLDGIRIAPDYGIGYWNAYAMHAADNSADYRFAVYTPNTSIFDGFNTATWTGVNSLNAPGFTDAIIVNRNTDSNQYDVGMADFSGVTYTNRTEHRSSVLPEYNAANGATENVSLATDQMILLRELYLSAAAVGQVVIELAGATQPVYLALWDVGHTIGNLSTARTTVITDAQGEARICEELTTGGFYCVAIYRHSLDGVGPQNLTLRVGQPHVAQASTGPGQRVSVFNLPDGTGRPLTQAQMWNGVPGSNPPFVNATVNVNLLNAQGLPRPGVNFEMLSSLGGLVPCPGGNLSDAPTNAAGNASFSGPLYAGGHTRPNLGELTQVFPVGVPFTRSYYGSTFMVGSDDLGNFFRINLATGAAGLICNGPPSTDLDYNPFTGLIYNQEPDGSFQGEQFNLATCSQVGPTVPTGGIALQALEYVNGSLYACGVPVACSPADFYKVDPYTGALSFIGPTGLAVNVSGLAYDPICETMYGVTGCGNAGPSDLFTIDMATGLATIIGNTQIRCGSLQFGPDGTLYAGDGPTAGVGGGDLWIIDRNTAAATYVGPTGFAKITGLTLVTGAGLDIQFNSADITGDRLVNLVDVGEFAADYLNSIYDYRSDFWWDGVLDLKDVGDFSTGIGATCPAAPKAAGVQVARAENQARVSFDPAGMQSSLDLEPGREVTAYLWVDGPAAAKGVTAFEGRIEASDNVVLSGFQVTGKHLNMANAPEFMVGLGEARVAEKDRPLQLMSFKVKVTSSAPAYIYLRGIDASSLGVDRPALVAGEERELLPIGAPEAETAEGAVAALNAQLDLAQGGTPKFTGVNLRNVPNPFNPATEIRFSLPKKGTAEVRIYDVAGRLVRRLGGSVMEAGPNVLHWNGTDNNNAGVVSGLYFYKLFLDGQDQGKAVKMTLVK